MYEHHFGFSKLPFRIIPDPEFFFPGANRGAVLQALVYAISRGEGIVKVVGEVGSGKTMLCRMLERELPEHCEIVYLGNPRLGADEILHAIAFELGIEVEPTDARLKVQHALQQHLLAKHAGNRRVVMFIEEAQAVPVETLEEIRLLSNLETTQEKLLQIVLFGQPELDDKLNLHEIRQLRERITHSFELMPLAPAQLRDYVTTRVRASGYLGPDLFTSGALKELERYSQGLLRRVNILADKALLAAFAANAKIVTAAHMRLAAQDSEFGRGRRTSPAWPVLLALLLLVAAVAAWWLSGHREFLPQWSMAPPAPTRPAAAASSRPTMTPSTAGAAAPAAGAGGPVQALQSVDHDAERPTSPTVTSASGLVGIDHLRPLRSAGPDLPSLEARWGDELTEDIPAAEPPR